jgi:hypothetical protein
MFNVSILVYALMGFYDTFFFKVAAIQFIIKYLFELIFLLPVTAFFKRQKLVWLLIIVAPLYIIYFTYIGMVGNNRTYTWKGREVR